MKILFQNRHEHLWQGGDMIQLRQTAAALERLGIQTEFSGEPVYPVPLLFRGFDVIHNFNFSMGWAPYQTWVAKKHKKPLVYSMIYHEGEQFVSYEKQQTMADMTDAMIFLTPGEIARVERHLKIDRAKCHVIPNGIDPSWFRLILRPDNLPQFVLTVGRVEQSKGQLPTAMACRKIGIQYVMIGQRTDEEYTAMCEAQGAIHLPSMPPEKLIKFYGQCSAFVLASAAEVMPLSAMEAMAQGAQVVLTDRCEWETPNVLRCLALDVGDVERQLRVALIRGKNFSGIREMQTLIWDTVAQKLKSIYESLCDI